MDFSKYINKIPLLELLENDKTKEHATAARKSYHDKNARIYAVFKSDLFVEFEVTKNPKAEKAFALAYERGHSQGYEEVYYEFEELVELIQ